MKTWEERTLDYWLVWKPFVGCPGVIAWFWTGGTVGLSPSDYLRHALTEYDLAREDFSNRNPGHPLARW